MFMLISISSCEKTIFKEYEQNEFYYLVEMVTVLEKVDIDGNIEKKNIINRTELEHDVDNLVLKKITIRYELRYKNINLK